MKLICDCGNETIFNTIDAETGKEDDPIEGEGQYATFENFEIYKIDHYSVGVCCKKCNKKIWMFS